MKHSTPACICALLLLTACGSKEVPITSGETTVTVVQPADVNMTELTSKLYAITPKTPLNEVNAIAAILVKEQSDKDTRALSDALWSGRNGINRNRTASIAVANASFKKNDEIWSRLRAGIGYLNGTGVEKNTQKAIELLSGQSLEDNAAAAYFLSRGYKADGNTPAEISALQRAQVLGHKRASERLAQLGY